MLSVWEGASGPAPPFLVVPIPGPVLNGCGVSLKAAASQQGGLQVQLTSSQGRPGAAAGASGSVSTGVPPAHLAPSGKLEGQVLSGAASPAPASPAALPGARDVQALPISHLPLRQVHRYVSLLLTRKRI